jgi:hypothetical protein
MCVITGSVCQHDLCSRPIFLEKGSDTTRSLGSAMQSVLREILDCCAITLSRFIKPGRADTNARYTTMQPSRQRLQIRSVLGVRWRRRVCWRWVVCSVADSVRGTTLTQELPTCASWHAIRSTEDWAPVIPTFERGDGGLGGSQPFGRMTFRG